jgi:hypothetical protein
MYRIQTSHSQDTMQKSNTHQFKLITIRTGKICTMDKYHMLQLIEKNGTLFAIGKWTQNA